MLQSILLAMLSYGCYMSVHTHVSHVCTLKQLNTCIGKGCLFTFGHIMFWCNNTFLYSRVLLSVRAATNCRYFFMRVVWSTTVGLCVGTKAMVVGGTERVALERRQTSVCAGISSNSSCLQNNRTKSDYRNSTTLTAQLQTNATHTMNYATASSGYRAFYVSTYIKPFYNTLTLNCMTENTTCIYLQYMPIIDTTYNIKGGGVQRAPRVPPPLRTNHFTK